MEIVEILGLGVTRRVASMEAQFQSLEGRNIAQEQWKVDNSRRLDEQTRLNDEITKKLDDVIKLV